MSPTLVFRDTALHSLARIRRDDKALFTSARHAIAQSADLPHPSAAVPWGATGVYQLHVGSIRILYEADAATATIYLINVAVTR